MKEVVVKVLAREFIPKTVRTLEFEMEEVLHVEVVSKLAVFRESLKVVRTVIMEVHDGRKSG